MVDWEPEVRLDVGIDDRGCVPFISQFIASDSLIPHVNIAGDARHVVTLVGLMIKLADPIRLLFIHVHKYTVQNTSILQTIVLQNMNTVNFAAVLD